MPVSLHQSLLAACLAAGPPALASHRGAAALWGFDVEPEIEITVPNLRQRGLAGVIVHRTRRLLPADVTEIDGIPATRPARTLLDLAAVLSRDDLEAALDSALREHLVSVEYLVRRLDVIGVDGRHGGRLLVRMALDRLGEGPAGSRREARLHRALVAAGLPRPVRQFKLRDEDGTFLARFDVAWPDHRVALEYQSYRHHFGRRAWRRDEVRRNKVTALDWLVLSATEDQLGPGLDELCREIDSALARPGACRDPT